MSEVETDGGLPQREQCGLILGYWDHEKTSELIQDLEQSVNLIEKKCKKLLEELVQYKKYLEKLGEFDFQLSAFKKKIQESRGSPFLSGSDPDIAFRKNVINFQKMQQVFEEKFQEKLFHINKKLTEAARKIGIKNNVILFPTKDYLKTLKVQNEDDEENVWCDLLEKFSKLNFFNDKTKSDTLITERNRKIEFSKITKNELKLYQKLSRLTLKRKKKLKGIKVRFIKGRNSRFFAKKKTQKCPRNLGSHAVKWKILKFSDNKLKNERKGLEVFQKGRNRLPRVTSSTVHSQKKLKESEIEIMCKSLTEDIGKNSFKSEVEQLKVKPSLGAVVRKAVPFTTCTSTSKSYNIGLNIQQLLSLSKHQKKTGVRNSDSEKMHKSTTAQNIKAVNFKQNFSGLSTRKARSKYTGTLAESVLEYHKSTMSQFSNGRKSVIKSESKTAYAVGSKIMVSDCQRTDIFEFEKNNNRVRNASGDGSGYDKCVKLNMEWTKIHNSFLSLYRKYTSLKEKIYRNNLVLADEELRTLESEIDDSIEKYKDFLRFYFKFLVLNHRLKIIKIACETKSLEPVSSYSSYCHEKMCQYRPTSSMTLKKALREVQTLQDKISVFASAITSFPSAMLEVMNAGSTELSCVGGNHEILLNCWNKSSPLIKELERTVNFAERKCGNLIQQLHFYKEYYEKWAQVERVNRICHKKKIKKCCRQIPNADSSSENELEKANQYFYKKIKSKMNEMNNEITQVNRKIQSRNENALPSPKNVFPPNPQPEEDLHEIIDPPSSIIENKTCKSEPTMTSWDVLNGKSEGIKIAGKQSSKSVPLRNKVSTTSKKDSRPSKRRYSNLQRYKIRSKSLPQGVRRKFGFGGFIEVFEPETVFKSSSKSRIKSRTSLKASSFKSCKSRKSKTGVFESRRVTPKSSRNRINKSKSDIRSAFRNAKRESEAKKNENNQLPFTSCEGFHKTTRKETNTCKAILSSSSIPEMTRTEIAVNDNLKNLIAKPNALLPFLRHPIPFIPCSSTSKSFNLGLNVQQVLSLIKRKRHTVTLQSIVRNSMQAARSVTGPMVNTLFISQTTTSHSHMTSAIYPARDGSEDSFSIVTDNRSKCTILKQVQTMKSQAVQEKIISQDEPVIETKKPERPEDVWVVEQPDSRGIRNSRLKCTCFPSKHCVDYHKVLKEYTGWRLPAPSHADTQSSYLCAKRKLYAIPSRDNIDFAEEENGRVELVKVHNDLLNLTRKYSSLQEQISQNCLDDYEANAELEALESELAVREIEFKDIFHFYNQLMALKEKLKSLKTRSGRQNQPAPRQQFKKDPLRPTPSMALAKVLKKIQGLQDKLKLIDTP